MECSYPDLFSDSSSRCEHFETVACGKRPEPQAPCKFSVIRSFIAALNEFFSYLSTSFEKDYPYICEMHVLTHDV